MGGTASQDTTEQTLGVVGGVMRHWAEIPFQVEHGQSNMTRRSRRSCSTYLASHFLVGAKWAIAFVVWTEDGRGGGGGWGGMTVVSLSIEKRSLITGSGFASRSMPTGNLCEAAMDGPPSCTATRRCGAPRNKKPTSPMYTILRNNVENQTWVRRV